MHDHPNSGDRRSGVTDTTKADPIVPLVAGMADGSLTPFIEGQERAGQAQVVNSTVLPTVRDDSPYVALGFTFGKATDELFREATLPEGWMREGSDHAMWSYVLDGDGYRRVAIFYKAAFYDRRADMHIERLPKTSAQSDAWEVIDREHGEGSLWMSGEDRREGPDYVYGYKGRYGDAAPEGKRAYGDDGRRLEVRVAPDGTILDRREFTVDATEETRDA